MTFFSQSTKIGTFVPTKLKEFTLLDLFTYNVGTREILIKVYERQEDILTRLKENGPVGMTQKTPQTIVVPPAVKVC